MRLLDRYLLRELFVPFGYCLSGFLVFWTTFRLLSELAGFQEQHLQALDIVQYYLLSAPEMLVVVLPVSLLLALLYALTNHTRHHELTAIRAAGVSLGRLALPYVAVGFILSLALFSINESWAPRGAEQAEDILNRHSEARANVPSRQIESQFGFNNTQDHRTWMMAAYHLLTYEMVNPQVSWPLPEGGRRDLFAERAVWREGAWVFTNVQILTYPPGAGQERGIRTVETNVLVMRDFTETPEDIRTEIKVRKISSLRDARRTQLSIHEILNYRRLHPDEREKRALLETKFCGRLAAPWTCLVVVLIALPFGAAPGRRNVFVGVAASIGIVFVYYVLTETGLALGARGTVPPLVAAWGPNVIFGLGGILLTWKIC